MYLEKNACPIELLQSISIVRWEENMSLLNAIPYAEEKKKNPELTDTDIDNLREWLQKQPHLPKMEDNEIALFLHSNYYRMEPTKSTIETYYTLRTHVPEFFANRDPLTAKDFQSISQCV